MGRLFMNGKVFTYTIIAILYCSFPSSAQWDEQNWDVFNWDVLSGSSTTTSVAATTYYVSNSGNDGNTGTSEGDAWLTIAHLSNFSPGDNILFNRGDVWRETLRCWDAGTSGNEITYSNYGTGNLPIIRGSNLVAVENWTADGSDWYWQPPATGAGSTRVEPMQVWENDERLDWVDMSGSAVITGNGQWGWASTGERVYIRPTDGTLDDEVIEVGQRCGGVVVSNTSAGTRAKQDNEYIIIDGIQVEKVAACGDDLDNPYDDGSDRLAYSVIISGGTNNTIRNCVVKQMGGGKYYTAGTNSNWSVGIEIYDSEAGAAYNNTIYDGHCIGLDPENLATGATVGYEIYNNTVYNIDGTGLTMVGGGGNTYGNTIYNCGKNHGNSNYRNICKIFGFSKVSSNFYNNLVYDGVRAFYVQNIDTVTLSIFYNIFHSLTGDGVIIADDADNVNFFNNVIYDDDGMTWVALNVSGNGTNASSNVEVRNNIIYANSDVLFNAPNADSSPTISNNCYLLEVAGNAFNWQGTTYTYANFNNWGSASGDINSIAVDPLFVDATNANFRLSSGSPCIDAGIDVGLTHDYYGNYVPRGSSPDIGIHEFTGPEYYKGLLMNMSMGM